MERFFWSLKYEWTNHERFANVEEARLRGFKCVETFYNPIRLSAKADKTFPLMREFL